MGGGGKVGQRTTGARYAGETTSAQAADKKSVVKYNTRTKRSVEHLK